MGELFKFTCGEHGELEGFEVGCKRCSTRYMDEQAARIAALEAQLREREAECRKCRILEKARRRKLALDAANEIRIERVAAELALTVTCDDPGMTLHAVARAVLAAADGQVKP